MSRKNNLGDVSKVRSATIKKSTNSNFKSLAIKVAVYVILWIALLVTLPFSQSIERGINHASFSFGTIRGEFAVHFIDVGQGDCTLIELPDGKVAMIDTGPAKAKNNLFKYLSSFKFTTIDYLIITHPDEDHIGNAVSIYEAYDVKTTYSPSCSSNYLEDNGLNAEGYQLVTSNVWSNTTKAMRDEGCDIIYNSKDLTIFDSSDIYDYSLKFFTPLRQPLKMVSSSQRFTNNDYSPFILVNLNGSKFMFTGDADADREAEFLSEYASLVGSGYFDVDVYKVGHHGSASSSSVDFLGAIRAEISVISCGTGNKYGHPAETTLERLSSVHSEVQRTDRDGSVVMTKDSSGIVTRSNFHHNSDFYLEWKYVVIFCAVLLIIMAFMLFFVPKQAKNNQK